MALGNRRKPNNRYNISGTKQTAVATDLLNIFGEHKDDILIPLVWDYNNYSIVRLVRLLKAAPL